MGWNLHGRVFLILFLFSFNINAQEVKDASMTMGNRTIRTKNIEEETVHTKPANGHFHNRYFYLNFTFTPELSNYIKDYSLDMNLKYINKNLKNSDLFREYIYKELQEKNMPLELFFIPMAETNFNPFAVSGANAVGMWQFTANSVEGWLEYDEYMDERRDFVLSTEAALEKLKYNYDMTGDWLLAISAYNAGLYRIQTMMKQNGDSKDFWYYYRNNLLPTQTKDYVLKILTYSYIAGYIGRYGFELEWGEKKDWEEITVNQPISIVALQELAGIKDESLVLANAKYNNGITLLNKESDIKVLKRDLDAVVNVLNNDLDKVAGYSYYKVKSGDSFYSIAHEYGMTVETLTRHNPEVSPSKLQAGYNLKIPVKNDVTFKYNIKSQLDEPVFHIDVNSEYISGELHNYDIYKNLDVESNSILYTVKEGDTLYSIAHEYEVTLEFLMFWNKKTNQSVTAGEVIKIPTN